MIHHVDLNSGRQAHNLKVAPFIIGGSFTSCDSYVFGDWGGSRTHAGLNPSRGVETGFGFGGPGRNQTHT